MADTQTDGPRADALVLFGITGDLAAKMVLPALYRLVRDGYPLCEVVGVSRGGKTLDELRRHAREAVAAHDTVDDKVFARFADLLHLAEVDYGDPESFQSIVEKTEGRGFLTHYLAIPPDLYAVAARCLASRGLNERARLVVEKPFGHDLASARDLETELTRYFPPDRLRRVDHYLGKDAIENLLTFRAANTLIDRALHRDAIHTVQISAVEDFDVADRGGFYDETGCLRDVVQNHLLQLLAYFVMETPRSGSAEDVVLERTRALRSVRTVQPDEYVRGQYEGYQDTPGVRAGSTTETYAALRLHVDTERWAGVPFTIQAGKALKATSTEVIAELRKPVPGYHHTECARTAAPNLLRFRFEPDAGVTFHLLARRGADETVVDEVFADADFPHLSGSNTRAYERILSDAISGDPRRFSSMESVTECWRIVGDILDPPDKPIPYRPGTWGPAEAARLTPDGHWYEPHRAV